MKKHPAPFFRPAIVLLLLAMLICPTLAARTLIPVGRAIGLELEAQGLTVAGFDEALGKAAKKAGLQEGDLIVKADGVALQSVGDLQSLCQRAQGDLILTVLRDGQEVSLTITPQPPEKRLGIYVREGISGVGTVTYYDPDTGSFGALGHGVSDSRGQLLPMRRGRALEAEIASVKKGRIGAPGQLLGAYSALAPLGDLEKNTPCGIFGTSAAGWPGTRLPVAEAADIETGPATILSNVTGTAVQEYSVKILRVYPESAAHGRNLLLRVTDPQLLASTGGIVQGMSGSPIIQDGKLVGAVTHVLVNDPTTGYGIFIENMLDSAG